MAFQIGESVLVPISRLRGFDTYQKSLYSTTIASVKQRSVQVNLRDGNISDKIGNSLCHKNVFVLILEIGDMETEDTLLDPLNKSILQYLRLLLPDDMIISLKMRNIEEFEYYWSKNNSMISHLIIIGHGRKNGIKFGPIKWINIKKIVELINIIDSTPKIIISLCCKTGQSAFAEKLSISPICKYYIAPFQSVHGAIASQFTQCLLAFHFLEGETPTVAFSHSRKATVGSANFRLWINGKMKDGPR